jgi:adenosine 3'-phospho 5'-phosphosulfate transporter B3
MKQGKHVQPVELDGTSPSARKDHVSRRKRPKWMSFLIQCAGIVFFFNVCAYIEEWMFKDVEDFTFSGTMTVIELFGFAIMAFVFLLDWKLVFSGPISIPLQRLLVRKAPISAYLNIALSMTAARLLTNESLEYLNYPTQVIFKSLKLPVVMLGSLIMTGKHYSREEYISAFMLAGSAALFSFGDASVSPSFSVVGIVMVLSSLLGDSIFSNLQEIVLQKHEASSEEMMLYSNFFGGCLGFLLILFSGELFDAVEFMADKHWLYMAMFVRAAVVYGGVWCISEMIRDFGVVLMTFVTTVRKILSILMSFVLFPKPWSSMYLAAIITFSGGLGIKLQYDYQKRMRQQQQVAIPVPIPQDEPNDSENV